MWCTNCRSQNVIKSGFVKGQQRYRCKDCCYQFVPTGHHEKIEQEKLTAVLLYINGLSLRTIAKFLKVSNVSVLNWVRKYALKNYEKPEGEAVIIEPDEMWHFIKSKKNKLWIWKAYNRTDKKLIEWGSVENVINVHY